MSPKNLSASKKTRKLLLNNLKNKKTFQIYNKFERNLKLNEDFIVAVSGGSDSLALSFLAKIYSIKKSIKVKYIVVDHKLRKNSTSETIFVRNLLKKISAKLKILKWIGKKPSSNIQSLARKKRYNLLVDEAKKSKIKNILLGHHQGDLYENFFIRILRGTGLNGLISLSEKTYYKNINLIRPLLKFSKKDLIYISKKIFGTYVQDPSNEDDKFKRVRIRKLIYNLESEGLDLAKFNLTIKNLKFANKSINFFIEKNINENTYYLKKNNSFILNRNFFNYPEEVVFRSLVEVIRIVGKKYYPVRGKKIDNLLELINARRSFKLTLGNCIIKKVKETIIIAKEH